MSLTIQSTVFSSICVIFLINCFIEQGAAIKCYECNSHTQKECELAIPPDHLAKNCTDTENKPRTMCRKIIQIIEFEVNGLQPDTRTIRSCGWDESNYVNRCYQRSGFGGRQEVCSCKTDLCNGGSPSYATREHIVFGLTVLAVTVYNTFINRV